MEVLSCYTSSTRALAGVKLVVRITSRIQGISGSVVNKVIKNEFKKCIFLCCCLLFKELNGIK